MINFGDALKYQREIRDLSQNTLAKATGISQPKISYYEKNQHTPPIDHCITLANFFDISLDELVGISDTPQEQSAASLPAKLNSSQLSFVKEYSEVISDENYINMSKLYKNITPSLRALALGYIVGLLQNNGIDTKTILGY
ncbi:MAG: helix-turn-helix transcriptional regulator [Clostridia bacterium]|jgi:transcriptional regulator with XRE-family HTH domain|nr:helix-turn-helix transcriptional regulator [Clostridia bacterium]